MATSPDLGIPYIATQQNQPEITHNEALNMIASVLKSAIAIQNAPPVGPELGDVYIVGDSPSGAWGGRDNAVAFWAGTAWGFVPGLDDDGSPIAMGARLKGLTMYVQTTDSLWRWSGTEWAEVAAGGGGSVKLDEVITSGSQSSVSFPGISQDYRDLELRITGRGTDGANDVGIELQFNGDSGANYDYQQCFLTSSASYVSQTGQSEMRVVQIPAGGSTANMPGGMTVTISDYSQGVFFKSVFSNGQNWEGSNLRTMLTSGVWRDTDPITDILVTLNAGNFVNGSRVSLYGIL